MTALPPEGGGWARLSGRGPVAGMFRDIAVRLARSRRGAAAIEFALGLPVLLLLVLGLVEAARAYWTQNTVEYAIERGARFVIVNPTATQSQVLAVVQANLTGLDAANLVVEVVASNTSGTREFTTDSSGTTVTGDTQSGTQSFVTVTGTYRFDLLVKFVGIGPFNLVTSSRMPIID